MIHVWTFHGVVFVQWGEKGVIRVLHPDGITEERFTVPSAAAPLIPDSTYHGEDD